MKRAAADLSVELDDRDDFKRGTIAIKWKRELLKHWRSLPADIRALIVPLAVRAPDRLMLYYPLKYYRYRNSHVVDSSSGARVVSVVYCGMDYYEFVSRMKPLCGTLRHTCGCRAFGRVPVGVCFWHAAEDRERAFFAAE